MTERTFRLILGTWLVAALYAQLPVMVYAMMAVLAFEGITNLRVPVLATRARYGGDPSAMVVDADCAAVSGRIGFEAERALRLIVFGLLAVSYVALPGMLWVVPWFVGFALAAAGISGICPMVLGLRWFGFR